ncbi:MAG: EAL domain-containing protein [Gammaproteobacteria bacterium]|nr:EAL domain-containing protein [Gammaproteobacteria bacterium]
MTLSVSVADRRTALLALSLFLLAALVLSYTKPFQRLDLLIYDLHAAWYHRPANDSVRIVSIDERSIQALGRWPWSRRLHGELIHKLNESAVRAIGLDIIFTEPDTDDPQGDKFLAEAIAASGLVVLPVFPRRSPQTAALETVFPIPAYAQAAGMLGHIDVELDQDGLSRSIFLKAGLGSARWPALPLAMLELGGALDGVNLPGQRNPLAQEAGSESWQRDYRILIPYAGPAGHFKTLSFVDVLRGTVDPDLLRDKWVLVGATAVGLGDRLATPASAEHQLMAGVEYNANVLDSLLGKITLQSLDRPWQFILTIVPLCLLWLLFPMCSPGGALLVWTTSLVGILGITMLLLVHYQRWFSPSDALILASASYLLWLWGSLRSALSQSSRERERAQAAYAALDQNIVVVDGERRVEYMSPSAERLTGFRLDWLRGRMVSETLGLIDDRGTTPFDGNGDGVGQAESSPYYLLKSPDQRGQLVGVESRMILDRFGQRHGWMVRLFEKSGARLSRDARGQSLFYDPLTGLPNRSLLISQLEQDLRRANRGHYEIALLFVNLDRFRQVNARLGYHGGDRLLKRVAERLRASVRESDILARNGSDEFVVVLEELGSRTAVVTVAEKIIEQLSRPYPSIDPQLAITASIGISLYPQDGEDSEALLNNAYLALRNRSVGDLSQLRFFSTDLHKRVRDRQDIELGLNQALAAGDQFVLHYQPQVEISSGRIIGAEALLRWRVAEERYIPPTDFIPVAEESGLIHQIGAWVFESASRQLSDWHSQGLELPRLSVNLSAVQLERRDVIDNFLKIVDSLQLDPSRLELEVTESALMRNMEYATALLRQFQAAGGNISVDDFGTGYSTFGYLKQLPINRLKIDKSFIRGITSLQDDAIITLTIISMARGLNLEVVAEGVESPEQLALLEAHGCDLGQGYLFAEPLPAKAFYALVRDWNGLGRQPSVVQ